MDATSWALHQRWLVRAPIALFRARLGFLTAGRLILLEHRGRTSGQARQVVLEVVDRPADDVVIVCAGLGPSSQWYRNIVVEPRVLVSIGSRRKLRALTRTLPPDEGTRVLVAYTSKHPGPWRELSGVLREWAVPLAAERGEHDWMRVIPVVEVRLRR